MINVTTPFLPILFSRNAAEITFGTPDKVITAGANFSIIMSFNTFPTTGGETLVFSFQKNGVTYARTFTFRVTPNAELYEIARYTGSGVEAFMQTVINGFLSDPAIAENFTFSVSFVDPVWGINIFAQFQSAAAPTLVATGFTRSLILVTTGAVGVNEAWYRFSAWLYIGKSATSSESNSFKTGEMELDCTPDQVVELDIQSYLDAYLSDPEVPTNTIGAFILCTQINRPAFLLFGQKWSSPYERQKQFKTPTFRVLKGGLGSDTFAAQKGNLGTYLSESFLTIRTDRRMALTKTKDWLFYHCNATATYRVRVKMYRDIGIQPLTITAFTAPMTAGQTYQFRSDTQAMIDAGFPTSGLYKYEVWLAPAEGITEITDRITYFIDEDYLDVIFEYENSLGAIEQWKMNGERDQISTASKSIYTKALPFNAAVGDTTLHSYNERTSTALQVSTGPLTAAGALAFPDFLRSRHVWLIRGTLRIRVLIPGGEALAKSWNLSGNHARVGKFTANLPVMKNVVGEVL